MSVCTLVRAPPKIHSVILIREVGDKKFRSCLYSQLENLLPSFLHLRLCHLLIHSTLTLEYRSSRPFVILACFSLLRFPPLNIQLCISRFSFFFLRAIEKGSGWDENPRGQRMLIEWEVASWIGLIPAEHIVDEMLLILLENLLPKSKTKFYVSEKRMTVKWVCRFSNLICHLPVLLNLIKLKGHITVCFGPSWFRSRFVLISTFAVSRPFRRQWRFVCRGEISCSPGGFMFTLKLPTRKLGTENLQFLASCSLAHRPWTCVAWRLETRWSAWGAWYN